MGRVAEGDAGGEEDSRIHMDDASVTVSSGSLVAPWPVLLLLGGIGQLERSLPSWLLLFG